MPEKYRMDLAYDGASFTGFQSQSGRNAIQDHLQRALQIALRHPTKVRGASRTDTGVHAEHQVAVFESDADVDSGRLRNSLNALLAPNIGIQQIRRVDRNFDPINHAVAKAYRYRLWLGFCSNPFIKRYVWEVPQLVDPIRLSDAAQVFLGRHDFSAFCNAGSDARGKEREILGVKVDVRGPLVDFWILGRGFLKQMIRIIVGTLIDQELGKLSATLPEILACRDRTRAGRTAPGQGLALVRIFYEEPDRIEGIIEECQKGYCISCV